MFGKACDDGGLDTVDSRSSGTRAVAMKVDGAPSSAPGEKITKKFEPKLCQSTRRRLTTRAVTATPWRSNVSVPPMPTVELLGELLLHGDQRLACRLLGRPPPSGDDAVAAGRRGRPRQDVLARQIPRDCRARVRASAGSGSPSIAARRERTTGISSGAVPPTPATRRAKAGAWSGCTSMKKKAGALSGGPGHELLAQARLEERDRDDQHDGEPERDRARRARGCPGGGGSPRLAATRASASGRAGPARPRGGRRGRAASSAPASPARKNPPTFHEPACQSASAARPAAIGDEGEPRPPAAQRGLDLAAQDQRGRDAPDLEQRPEREEQRDADAHREAARGRRRARRRGRRAIGRRRPGAATSAAGARCRRARRARCRARPRSDWSAAGRWTASAATVAPRHLRMAIVRELLPDEGAHADGDADAAHHQRDEPREAQVHGELIPESAEPGLRLRVRW